MNSTPASPRFLFAAWQRTGARRQRPFALFSIAGCAGLACASIIFGFQNAQAADPPPAPRPALTVTTALPQRSSQALTLAANGSIAAWQEAVIGSQANGLRLSDVRASVGDVVRLGQVLATFAAETVQAELAQSRASVMEAEATAADAAVNAQRARTLEKSGALSASQIAQYATADQTARARVEAARAAYNAQKLRLGFAEVRAPDSGVISARNATVGSVVPAGTELFRMVRQGRLEWRAEVTSAELGRIRTGMPVRVTAASGAQLDGRVRMVGPTVDPQTRNALVYVDLPGAGKADNAAKAGMFARGEFVLGQTDALTVPSQSVVVREAFSYVFVPGPDNRVAQRKVQTGRRIGDRLEITNGLGATEAVVVNGAGFLNDRDLVRIAPASAPDAAAAPATPSESTSNRTPAQVPPTPAAIK